MVQFESGEATQQLRHHVRLLKQLGFHPQDTSTQNVALYDLVCTSTGTVIECKSEHQAEKYYAIELASNLPDTPLEDATAYRWDTPTYSLAVEFLRQLGKHQPQKLGIGLYPHLAPQHLLSHLFLPSLTHTVFNLQTLQKFIHQSLKDCAYDIVRVQSSNNGNYWYSLNMLVPVEKLRAIAITITTTTATTAAIASTRLADNFTNV